MFVVRPGLFACEMVVLIIINFSERVASIALFFLRDLCHTISSRCPAVLRHLNVYWKGKSARSSSKSLSVVS